MDLEVGGRREVFVASGVLFLWPMMLLAIGVLEAGKPLDCVGRKGMIVTVAAG